MVRGQRGDLHLGLSGNAVLHGLVEPIADEARVRRAVDAAVAVRRYTEVRYGARSWRCERSVAARIEATLKGLDARYVVTNFRSGTAEWLSDTLYCARGQPEAHDGGKYNHRPRIRREQKLQICQIHPPPFPARQKSPFARTWA